MFEISFHLGSIVWSMLHTKDIHHLCVFWESEFDISRKCHILTTSFAWHGDIALWAGMGGLVISGFYYWDPGLWYIKIEFTSSIWSEATEGNTSESSQGVHNGNAYKYFFQAHEQLLWMAHRILVSALVPLGLIGFLNLFWLGWGWAQGVWGPRG